MSRMPVFGPGPGQYQSQTTFNPALQPTVQVEQQQSLFAQIAGLVPVAAEAAAGVINLQTKSKIQDYQEREAAAKLEATNNGDLRILENFYQNEMATTGIQPPAIRTAATESLVGVKQTINKYNEELQKTAAKEQEDLLKRQAETDLQILDVNLEAVKYMYEVDGNFSVSAEKLAELSKQYQGNLKAQEKIIAAQTRFGLAQKDIVNKQIEQSKTDLLDRRKKAGDLVDGAIKIFDERFKVDNKTKDFVKTEGLNGIILTIGTSLQQTNPDPRIIWNPETGLPENDPILRESIVSKALYQAQLYNIAIQKDTLQTQIDMRVENVEKSIKFGAQYFVDSLTNAEEFMKTLGPSDQVAFRSKIEQAVNKLITGVSAEISMASNPQQIAEAAYNMTEVFKATPFYTRTAGTSEALNRLQSNAISGMTNMVLASAARAFSGAQPTEHVKEWLINTDGTPSNITFGDFALVEQLKVMVNPTDGSPIFTEQELNKIIATGDFSTALTFGQDDTKDQILTAAIDVSKSFRDKTNTDKDGKPKQTGPTVEQVMRAMQSGVKVGALADKVILPSQLTRNPIAVNDGITGYEGADFTADRIKYLTNSREPGDQNEQLRLATIMAMQDKQILNGDNPTLKYVQDIASDLSSNNQFAIMRGIAAFNAWGGFKNPAIRSYLRNTTESQLTDVQLIQLAHIANIVDETGKPSVPDGMPITQYLQRVAAAADPEGAGRQTVGVKEFTEVLNALNLSGVHLFAREADFIKTSFESTKALYPNADATAVVKSMLDKNGFQVVNQPDGSKDLFVDPYGYYVEEDKRQKVITNAFNRQIPEQHKESYRKYFGVGPGVKFDNMADLIAIKFAQQGVSKQDMYDLTWNLSYDENNLLSFFDTAPGNMSPNYQLMRGGVLQFWNDRTSAWETIYAADGFTEIRLTEGSLDFPRLSDVPESSAPMVKAMTPQEKQAAKAVSTFNKAYNPIVSVGTRSR